MAGWACRLRIGCAPAIAVLLAAPAIAAALCWTTEPFHATPTLAWTLPPAIDPAAVAAVRLQLVVDGTVQPHVDLVVRARQLPDGTDVYTLPGELDHGVDIPLQRHLDAPVDTLVRARVALVDHAGQAGQYVEAGPWRWPLVCTWPARTLNDGAGTPCWG